MYLSAKFIGLVLPVVYFLTPFTVLFEDPKWRFGSLLFVLFFKAFSIIVAFPSTTILLTNSCTSVRILGTLNGFATTFSGLGRALGPASTGAIFSWGADTGYIVAPWLYLSAVALIGAIPAFMIVEGDGPSASLDVSDSEDDTLASSSLLLPNESAISDDSDDERSEDDGLSRTKGKGRNYGTIDSLRK